MLQHQHTFILRTLCLMPVSSGATEPGSGCHLQGKQKTNPQVWDYEKGDSLEIKLVQIW